MAGGRFDLVVRGGTVVTAADTVACDVGVRDGRIVALGEDLGEGVRTVDASGRLVLPGGVDAHVHIDEPPVGPVAVADDFASGTRAAAFGGTTTIIPFATQEPDRPLRATVEDYLARAEGAAHIDYGCHLIINRPDTRLLGQDLPSLVADGFTSLKLYMTYEGYKVDDREMLDVMSVAKDCGATVMVHAENDHCLHFMRDRLAAAGERGTIGHAHASPMVAEREATHRAIAMAELAGVPVLFVHVSTADAMEQIDWARRRGLDVRAETCPQYLVLDESRLDRPDMEGAKFVCSPPLRPGENIERLWRDLLGGGFDLVSSDHCPYVFAGRDGKQHAGPDAAFHEIPPGLPGIELRLALLFSEAVSKRGLSLNRFVAMTATNPARIYGLYPRKGTLAVGADADMVLWDPQRRVTVRHGDLHENVDYSPYEGMDITGWPVTTIARGEVICDEGTFLGTKGTGRFLRRSARGAT